MKNTQPWIPINKKVLNLKNYNHDNSKQPFKIIQRNNRT